MALTQVEHVFVVNNHEVRSKVLCENDRSERPGPMETHPVVVFCARDTKKAAHLSIGNNSDLLVRNGQIDDGRKRLASLIPFPKGKQRLRPG